MIRALTEAGVPIDIVGGTSMGAFVAAVWCDETNVTTLTQKCRGWAMVSLVWVKEYRCKWWATCMFIFQAKYKIDPE